MAPTQPFIKMSVQFHGTKIFLNIHEAYLLYFSRLCVKFQLN